VKVLVLRFSSIGDIVLTTPILRCIKKQLPNVELHFASKKAFAGFLKNNPNIDKLHLLEDEDLKLIKRLKREKFDYIIDLHNNLRTFRIKKALLSAKTFSFNKLNFKKALLVNLKINQLPEIHIVDRYFEAVRPLGVKNDKLGLDYFIEAKDEVNIKQFNPNFPDSFVAFAIGGQHNTKRLPIHKQIELCRKIASPIILLGGKEDEKDAQDIENEFLGRNKILNLVGKINLNQSASVVRQAQQVFTHDTGMMHIAAAFKKEIFTIWGNTVPDFGMYPYLTKFHNLEVLNLACRPCSKIGFDQCPKGHFKCMELQNFDQL
jgi:ADP-heptose:LPS heptosyltransferase